jgi:MoaA/NifB/PqqE/SkfB family radical SAM enzyme
MRLLPYLSSLSALLKGQLVLERKPLILCLNVANRCNLSCAYCYGDYSNRRVSDFTGEELLSIIKEAKDLGTWIIYISGAAFL